MGVLHAAFGPVAAETLGLANNGLDAGDFWISYWPVVAASLVALVAAASSNTPKHCREWSHEHNNGKPIELMHNTFITLDDQSSQLQTLGYAPIGLHFWTPF